MAEVKMSKIDGKKRVLFDLDGTLTDSGEGIKKSVRVVFEHFGFPVPDDTELRKFIGPPLRDTFQKYGIPEDRVEEAIRVYRARYFTVGKFENEPYVGIPELLTRLKEQGYLLYVVTSKPEDLSVEILRHFSLAQFFDLICGATMDRSAESKASVIARLAEQIGDVDGSVMVGDTAFDVVGANEHGLATVGVSWGFGGVDEMRAAGAVSIVDTPDALYDEITRLLG